MTKAMVDHFLLSVGFWLVSLGWFACFAASYWFFRVSSDESNPAGNRSDAWLAGALSALIGLIWLAAILYANLPAGVQ